MNFKLKVTKEKKNITINSKNTIFGALMKEFA